MIVRIAFISEEWTTARFDPAGARTVVSVEQTKLTHLSAMAESARFHSLLACAYILPNTFPVPRSEDKRQSVISRLCLGNCKLGSTDFFLTLSSSRSETRDQYCHEHDSHGRDHRRDPESLYERRAALFENRITCRATELMCSCDGGAKSAESGRIAHRTSVAQCQSIDGHSNTT